LVNWFSGKILKLLPPDVSFKAKMHQSRIGCWGSAPDPARRAYSAPPDPLAVFKGPTSEGREGNGNGKKGGMERRGGKGEGEGLQAPQCEILATPLPTFKPTYRDVRSVLFSFSNAPLIYH